ncbi:MAG: hypothetical protein KA163_07000 [Bacteroidia bacterium]|nr:hypothetical protein [Bacteroidia bacterium]
MENAEIYKTDLSKKDNYLKKFRIRYFLTVGLVITGLLLFMIVAVVDSGEGSMGGMMFFPFILLFGMLFFLKCRAQAFLTHYLKAEFIISNEALFLLIDGKKRKVILFKNDITIKTIHNGTYILNGKYTWYDLNMSKYPPTKIPTKEKDIFIPSIVYDYEFLIQDIEQRIKLATTIPSPSNNAE